MEDPAVALARVRTANEQLGRSLARIEEALAGRAAFTSQDLRAIAEPVRAMAPVISRAEQLRAALPGLQDELEIYSRNLREMDRAFDRVRCLLLSRCAQIEARRGHLDSVRLWADAWRQTR
jgi:hypothetical protein